MSEGWWVSISLKVRNLNLTCDNCELLKIYLTSRSFRIFFVFIFSRLIPTIASPRFGSHTLITLGIGSKNQMLSSRSAALGRIAFSLLRASLRNTKADYPREYLCR